MFNSNSSFLGNISPVVRNLLIINVLFFVATWALAHKINLSYYLGLHYWEASAFNPAQFISYMFMHAGFSHLFFNMFGLWMFGQILERVMGTKRFLLYYFICGVGAAIVQQLLWTIEFRPFIETMNNYIGQHPSNVSEIISHKISQLNIPITIGASGAIFGLLIAFAMLFPNQPMFLIFLPIPIKAKYFVVGYAIIELFFGVGNFNFDNIAHFAHLGGMLFGFITLLFFRRDKRNFY
ncbi:MAG: rhomboid family intramembrane serine protease [Prevotellaceae bacterium]|jgi:membrane associated rhomboid family serine protease|nr:rhomboid family intramembrane serine protease [Prevotellaceae bacterium]